MGSMMTLMLYRLLFIENLMHSNGKIKEIFLHPGEIYFGDYTSRIRTVLGSCVSLLFWHPQRRVGGMCHFMLPTRRGKPLDKLDGRYADEAMQLALQEMKRFHTTPDQYRVKIFGGGNMFPSSGASEKRHIGIQNIEAARQLVQQYQLNCVSEHIGGNGYRKLVFDAWDGRVRQSGGATVGSPKSTPMKLEPTAPLENVVGNTLITMGRKGWLPSK